MKVEIQENNGEGMDLEIESSSHLAEAKTHLDQAYSYKKSQDFDQVLVECGIAIEIDSNLAEAYNLKGIALEELGRKAEAVEAYQQAINLAPDFSEAQDRLAALEDELSLFPHWFRDILIGALVGVLAFLAIVYGIESYIISKDQISTLDRLLMLILITLYTPGVIVQSLIGNTGLQEPGYQGFFNWTIRIVSSLPFICIGVLAALRRKRALLIFAIVLLLLYSLICGIWYFLSLFGDLIV